MSETENETTPENRTADDPAEAPPATDPTTTEEPTTPGQAPPPAPGQPPIAGDVILQVHIANIFLTFCQKYARLCDRRMRRFLEFIVLIKVGTFGYRSYTWLVDFIGFKGMLPCISYTVYVYRMYLESELVILHDCVMLQVQLVIFQLIHLRDWMMFFTFIFKGKLSRLT